MGDAIVNAILIPVGNWLLLRHEPAIPVTNGWLDPAPSLMGSLGGLVVVMGLLLTLIVYGLTVAQRRKGVIAVPIEARPGWLGPALKLARLHILAGWLAICLLALIADAALAGDTVPPEAAVTILTLWGTALAMVLSLRTTRAALMLGVNR